MASVMPAALAPAAVPAATDLSARRARAVRWIATAAIAGPIVVFALWALVDNARLFLITLLNGLTLGSLYFIVASGFTLVFGLMRNVNLAHGSLYLLGGYVGFTLAEKSGSWLLAAAAGFAVAALAGLAMQLLIFRRMPGQDLRQTMVTIGLSIVIADLLMWFFGAQVHQMDPPAWLADPLRDLPLIRAYSSYRLSLLPIGIAIGVALWLFLNRTRVGMMIRAGVDDRGMLSASGVNVNLVFAITFAIGAGLAGFGGVIGAVELSMVPGEDTRLLLASLVVVIVGGMGSVVGAAIGAAILGLAETFGLAYAPTYSVVFTFVILVLVLAFRPRGILGRAA
jgi:branched-chain amino acid transport system permease protein